MCCGFVLFCLVVSVCVVFAFASFAAVYLPVVQSVSSLDFRQRRVFRESPAVDS